jgi:hypothetical protein
LQVVQKFGPREAENNGRFCVVANEGRLDETPGGFLYGKGFAAAVGAN